jgi:putative ABC transport system permease protein
MDDWLKNFTFRTTINPLTFIVTGMLLMITAWITLSHLLWKVSTINPAEILKNE